MELQERSGFDFFFLSLLQGLKIKQHFEFRFKIMTIF